LSYFRLRSSVSRLQVEIAWKDSATLRMAEERFGIDLSNLKLNKNAYQLCQSRSSIFKRFLFTIKYSLVFWVSDGSLPFLFSQNNLAHFRFLSRESVVTLC